MLPGFSNMSVFKFLFLEGIILIDKHEIPAWFACGDSGHDLLPYRLPDYRPGRRHHRTAYIRRHPRTAVCHYSVRYIRGIQSPPETDSHIPVNMP